VINLNDGTKRKNIKPGLHVNIVLKEDQCSGNLTEGFVKNILTNSSKHRMVLKCVLKLVKSAG